MKGKYINEAWPLRIRTETNRRDGHWGQRHKRRKAQRTVVYNSLKQRCRKVPKSAQVTVSLVRTGPRKLDRHNISDAFKAVIDGVADALGRDDADPSIKWMFNQNKGNYFASVTITWMED